MDEHILRHQPHRYDFVEKLIESHVATVPLELIFSDRMRPRVSVAGIGHVTHMRIVFVIGSTSQSSLGLTDGDLVDDFLLRRDETQALTCAPLNTAAGNYLALAYAEELTTVTSDSEHGTRRLAEWLREKQGVGVLLCDTGIAMDVRQYWIEQGLPGRLGTARVPYPEHVAAGIAYVVEDPVWGETIDDIVRAVTSSTNERIVESLALTKAIAQQLDIEMAA